MVQVSPAEKSIESIDPSSRKLLNSTVNAKLDMPDDAGDHPALIIREQVRQNIVVAHLKRRLPENILGDTAPFSFGLRRTFFAECTC